MPKPLSLSQAPSPFPRDLGFVFALEAEDGVLVRGAFADWRDKRRLRQACPRYVWRKDAFGIPHLFR